MKHFKELHHLSKFDLKSELDKLINDNVVEFDKENNQISLNTVVGKEHDYKFGCGSLVFDWSKAVTDGDKILEVPKFEKPFEESDFTVLCEQFKGTLFENVYNELNSVYHVGRIRIMRSKPKTCLTWHIDYHPRVHYPIVTSDGCFMVIDDEVMHLPENTWWYTNTLLKHTAFNGSGINRIHLVATIIGEK